MRKRKILSQKIAILTIAILTIAILMTTDLARAKATTMNAGVKISGIERRASSPASTTFALGALLT